LADGEAFDLAARPVAVVEGERFDAFRRDPDAQAGAGEVADGVGEGARRVGADGDIGQLFSR
jgi:hypothetical protein